MSDRTDTLLPPDIRDIARTYALIEAVRDPSARGPDEWTPTGDIEKAFIAGYQFAIRARVEPAAKGGSDA